MEEISSKVLFDLIKPHLGDISFTGHHEVDMEHVKNIDGYDDMVYWLIDEIIQVKTSTEGRCEQSARDLHNASCHALECIKEYIDE